MKRISVESTPKTAEEWLVDICLAEGWRYSESDAREAAEMWSERFLNLLRRELSELNAIGRFVPFAFNSSSDYMLQGCAFIEPWDSEEDKKSKQRRSLYAEYADALSRLTPRQFEALCAGLLDTLGVDEPTLTRYSADEGIDFYGKLNLKQFMFADAMFPGPQHQLSVWMIGQAKHYATGDVSTFEIRDLVGAVELARGKAFGAAGERYADLNLRVCDPIFYLFFTTGRITANTWRLLEKSGVAGMDGDMVASFLADQAIGTQDGEFSVDALNMWIRKREEVS
jgi:hypothetical protein